MNIVYASDNNFAEVLGISMISLFENNKECAEIIVYVLDGGIAEDNKQKLISISEKYGRTIIYLNVEDLFNNEMKQQRGSMSTFSRLYLTKLLPEEVSKVLYLDCDMLIEKSIEDMYSTDLTQKYCAGVNDCVSDGHLDNIALKSGDNYFNAGVLLINVDEWRKDNIVEKFERFSAEYNDDVPYADQGIVNGVMSHKSIALELKYNCYTALYDFSYKDLLIFRNPSKYYSETEAEEAKKNPAIVHFTTSFLSLRPWIEGCKHPYADEWIKYKKMSPWADVPMREDKRSGKKKLAVKIYKALPNGLSVRIAGLLHTKLVPMLRKK